MISLGWTKSTLPLSVMIRWAANQPVSHFIIVLDNKVVMQSNLLGVHIDWLETFQKECDIVYTIPLTLDLTQEEQIYQNCLTHDERPYDYPAFFWLAWRLLLLKLFKIPIPTKNPWNQSKADICTELASALSPVIKVPDNLDDMLPYDLYLFLSKELNG